MKLAEHVEHIRQLIDKAFRNRFGRMGITVQWASNNLQKASISNNLTDCQLLSVNGDIDELKRIIDIFGTFEKETGNITAAYEKLIEEFTFTLFNRLAAMKVMEAHTLHAEIVTRRSQHGDRSFAHFLWLEQNPDGRIEEQEGLIRFFEDQLTILTDDIPLFSLLHPYHLLPTTIELNGIINAFNQVESDGQVESDIWKSDDVLGWLYEAYNGVKRKDLKESKQDIEYDKVHIQSCIYTPRWVVKFLVDNSLGKLYLEMYPDSPIKEKYKIANAPKTQTRERKPLTEIRLIDLATGSGNFVLYGFDLFYDFYIDQIENYGADYNENSIPELIIRNNLYGIDLDDRAIQLAQLGLYIKAKRKKRTAKIKHFNIVSSDFFLPDFKVVKYLFENGEPLSPELEKIVKDLWIDLQQAYKFGSLIRLEEKFKIRLHGLVQQFEKAQLQIFSSLTLANYDQFRDNFFSNLKKAVAQNAAKQGQTILNSKTHDAITFLDLLTQKYDVAVSNPPYTDSADFGTELKKFIEANYKQPLKFNSNLYAAFIKRCYDMTDESGFVALIHPHTFMFIKSFEDVRKFIIEHLHLDVLVDYGLDRVNLFGTGILLDATWYVLSKKRNINEGLYFNITTNQQEKYKQISLSRAYEDFLNRRRNDRVYSLAQSKLSAIEGYPFIYWISDGFREKFKERLLDQMMKVCAGLSTANNNRFVRFWWEIENDKVSRGKDEDNSHWVTFYKGGPYNKWYGNVWMKVFWKNNGEEIKNFDAIGRAVRNENYYFKEGITLTGRSSSKGTSFLFMDCDGIFDIGASGIIPFNSDKSLINVTLGVLNSSLAKYIIDSLNPTVNTTEGDLKKIPIPLLQKSDEQLIENLVVLNIEKKKHLCSYHIVETNFNKTPLDGFQAITLKYKILDYLNFENAQLTEVLLNEAIINELIFEIYQISSEDRQQVEAKMGKPVGTLPVLDTARVAFLEAMPIEQDIVKKHLTSLAVVSFKEQQIQTIQSEFTLLYQSNNNLEEFCIHHQVNPINVWYWFREYKILPQGKAHEIALEFLTDACRSILMEDEDGIIPLVGLPNEPRLLDRLEQYCLKIGLSSAQFMQLDGLLGHPINDYIEHHFFRDFSNHLNLFMYFPKTPFIWHLSSGENQGFEVYIIIYKWNRDSLFKLKSQYLNKRIENLEYRQIQLQGSDSAQAQNEKEKIRLQLQEIAEFTKKIEELIAEGYDPKLDDGVGKNIAPLQNKGLLHYDVLNKKQLEKYLNADW